MRIGKDEVIILFGGDLTDEARQELADAVEGTGARVSRVLANVDGGMVNGDDGTGHTNNMIQPRDDSDEESALPTVRKP